MILIELGTPILWFRYLCGEKSLFYWFHHGSGLFFIPLFTGTTLLNPRHCETLLFFTEPVVSLVEGNGIHDGVFSLFLWRIGFLHPKLPFALLVITSKRSGSLPVMLSHMTFPLCVFTFSVEFTMSDGRVLYEAFARGSIVLTFTLGDESIT